MNGNPLIGKLKILAIFFVLLVVGLWKGGTDLNYAFFGKTTTAQVKIMKVINTSGRRGRKSQSIEVIYEFKDNKDVECSGYSTQSINWQPPFTQEVEIKYLPGEKETKKYTVSRLSADSSISGITLFFIGCLGIVFWGRHTYTFMSNTGPE